MSKKKKEQPCPPCPDVEPTVQVTRQYSVVIPRSSYCNNRFYTGGKITTTFHVEDPSEARKLVDDLYRAANSLYRDLGAC